uniref:Uncharacterized protein n=1 Tax=Stegastes partitus TaxID=144197 RepID=A0A3B5ABE3_9TELE
MFLTQRHETNSHLTQVEVDKMLRLVRHVAAKVPPNNAVPCGVVLFVKLLQVKQTVCGNVLLNIVLLHGLHGTVHRILLHFIRHICILDHCLLVRHVGRSIVLICVNWGACVTLESKLERDEVASG